MDELVEIVKVAKAACNRAPDGTCEDSEDCIECTAKLLYKEGYRRDKDVPITS